MSLDPNYCIQATPAARYSLQIVSIRKVPNYCDLFVCVNMGTGSHTKGLLLPMIEIRLKTIISSSPRYIVTERTKTIAGATQRTV